MKTKPSKSESITILLADSDPVALSTMTQALLTVPDVTVSGGVRSRDMLIARIKHIDVDLLILDLDAEGLGGVTVMDEIRDLRPDIPVLIVYDSGKSNPETAVKALQMGASDCIQKPGDPESLSFREFRLQLLTILGLVKSRKAFGRKHRRPTGGTSRQVPEPARDQRLSPSRDLAPGVTVRPGRIKVVVIASSTGGPGALVEILPRLPADLGVPVLLVQHMPSHMTSSFAKSLDARCAVSVVEALDGDEILPSRVYVAPGGRHLAVSPRDGHNRRFIRLTDAPPENSVRPSADVLFRSVADSYEGAILAVILTGMGEDGKKGVMAMKEKGCICFTQNPDSCVVYGMPRAVDDAGLSDASLDLDLIPIKLAAAVKQGL
ncbi:MAG: chemotaxis protein CheB [Pseudomonadota bacterium]